MITIGSVIHCGKSIFRVIGIRRGHEDDLLAMKIDGPAREARVAFRSDWVRYEDLKYQANSYSVIEAEK